MENKKKEDINKELSIKQSLEATKGPVLYGDISLLKPKKYKCDNCGEILAADILWKDIEDAQKPFCGNCRNPVVLILK